MIHPIVQGVTKYLDNVRLSELERNHKHFRPLYLSKEYNQGERQISKYMGKMTWFDNKEEDGREWRSLLKGKWVGAKLLQRKVKGMNYTTVIKVPTSEDSKLLVGLAKREPKIARMVGYNVKLTEKSGIQLARLFNRVTAPERCNWEGCIVCKNGGSKCKIQNVVYRATCKVCEEDETQEKYGENKKRKLGENSERREERGKSMYIGETGRCLAERSNEHINGMMNGDKETFIIKHWALKHPDLKIPPRVEFKVVKNHRDCMTRLIHEAVLIDKEGSMNSKSEWRKNSRPRLMIEKSEWEKKKEYKQVIEEEREEEERIEEIIRLIENEKKQWAIKKRGKEEEREERKKKERKKK